MDLSVAFRELQKMLAELIAELPHLSAAIVLVGVMVVIGRIARWIVMRALERRTPHESLRLAAARLTYAAIMAVGLLVAATIAFPSFTVGSLISLLGVSGVVVGFAFKDIFQNFIAGILILVTNPFEIGDEIKVDDFEGRVEQIETRATFIETYDRRRVVVPNSDLFTKSVIVNTAFKQRRAMCDITVKGDADPTAVKHTITTALRGGIQGVDADPLADAVVTKITGDSTTVRVLWWSSSRRPDYMLVQDRVLTAVRTALEGAGMQLT